MRSAGSADPGGALRRLTAGLTVAWTLLCVSIGALSFLSLPTRPSHRFLSTTATGRYVVVSPDAIARRAGVERGHLLLEVNGVSLADRPLSSAQVRTEALNRYRLERQDGSVYEVLLPHRQLGFSSLLVTPSTYLYLLVLAVVALYLAVGIRVYWSRPDLRSSWALLLLTGFVASYLSGALHPGRRLPGSELTLGLSASLMLVPGLHLVTMYPIELEGVRRRRSLLLLPYALALLFFCGYVASYTSGRGYETAMRALLYWNVAVATSTVAYMVAVRRRMPTRDLRDRLDIALLGYTLAAGPVGVVLLLQDALRATLPSLFAFGWFVGFPLVIGVGILRQPVFGIRDVAKSSFVYGALSVAITGAYALAVAVVGTLYGGENLANPWVSLTLIFGLVLVLSPLRERLRGVADRLFERDRARYQEAVRAASDAMVSLLSLDDIVERVLSTLTESIRVDSAAVLLLDEESSAYALVAARGHPLPEGFHVPKTHPLLKLVWVYRDGLSADELSSRVLPEARDACDEVFATLAAELMLPLAFGVDLRGVLVVGRSRSGEPLKREDREMVRTFANQAAVAIENALAYGEIARLNRDLELRIEARTRELREAQSALAEREKMASLGRLVAGVAHEINNPVGFVHSNLQLVGEQVDRLLRAVDKGDAEAIDRTRENLTRLVERSREGTSRIREIVRALRIFSRVDQSGMAQADLREGLETTLDLMAPRLRGIDVVRQVEPLPPVRCHAGQINQVLMNLLVNACDAGARRIVIRASARGGTASIEVEDDGGGIAAEDRTRIFEPFFTTKAVGKGTGLGLAISHGIVERHGGRIRLLQSGSTGTAFRVELPVSGPPPEPSPKGSEDPT